MKKATAKSYEARNIL